MLRERGGGGALQLRVRRREGRLALRHEFLRIRERLHREGREGEEGRTLALNKQLFFAVYVMSVERLRVDASLRRRCREDRDCLPKRQNPHNPIDGCCCYTRSFSCGIDGDYHHLQLPAWALRSAGAPEARGKCERGDQRCH